MCFRTIFLGVLCIMTGVNGWIQSARTVLPTEYSIGVYRTDTVTIIGQYQGMRADYFHVDVFNPVTQMSDYFMTTVDSLGHFELRFPLRAAQEVLLDWHSLGKKTIFIPGEQIEIVIRPSKGRRPDVEVTGGARMTFHNEQFNFPYLSFSTSFKGVVPTPQAYLKKALENWKLGCHLLDDYRKEHPDFSEESYRIAKMQMRCLSASSLLISLLEDSVLTTKVITSPSFTNQLCESFPLDDEASFFLSRDMIFYAYNCARLFGEEVLTHPVLREMRQARSGYQRLQQREVPLEEEEWQQVRKGMSHLSLWTDVIALQQKLTEQTQPHLFYESSLKDNAPFVGITDGEKLLRELVAPYKGKVVYIDFWGVWCGPCKRQLGYIAPVKEQFKGKDVIFMYLANASPKEQWRKMIEKLGLTGEQVVHYNLPSRQQSAVEQWVGVRSFPTFILIDKQGRLVDKVAPFPEMKDKLTGRLNELLSVSGTTPVVFNK